MTRARARPGLLVALLSLAAGCSGCGGHDVKTSNTPSEKRHLAAVCRERDREVEAITRHELRPIPDAIKPELEHAIPASVLVMDAAIAELRTISVARPYLLTAEKNRARLRVFLNEARMRRGNTLDDLPPRSIVELIRRYDRVCSEPKPFGLGGGTY